MFIFNFCKNLINNQFHSKEEMKEKVDVFFAVGRFSQDEYNELNNLIENTYK